VRKIGLLGGMSWESTAEYYRLLNEGVRAALGGLHSARVVLASVDFAEVERMQAEERWDEAGELLAAEARGLEAAGAELVLLCTNTMHKVADTVAAAIEVPLLHLADATADAVAAAGLTTVGLLGTAFTMEQDFYRGRLASHGLTVLVPDVGDRSVVHGVIYDELCVGVVRDAARDAVRAVAERLVDRGAQGVVLGCTELELLLTPGRLGQVPLFPTTRLHVAAALNVALGS
jgi:aspartate racemase